MGSIRRFLVLVALLVSACGAVGQGSSPTPSDNPMHFDVTATEKDHAVSMQVGQRLEVVLHGGTQTRYQQVRSSDPSILVPTVDPAATAVIGVTLASFKAVAAGETTVTAVGTAVCPTGQACPMYALLYTLKVTIS